MGAMQRDFAAQGTPAIHFRAFGFTRGPAIMRDPIAKDNPMQATNWGTQSDSDFIPDGYEPDGAEQEIAAGQRAGVELGERLMEE